LVQHLPPDWDFSSARQLAGDSAWPRIIDWVTLRSHHSVTSGDVFG